MLALIAGQGALPAILANRLDAQGEPYVLAALKDSPPDALHRPVDFTIDMTDLGRFFADLKSCGTTKVAMAGAVSRPDFEHANDTISEAARRAKRAGDDGLLKVIVGLFENQGIQVVAAHELVPELLPAAGVTGGVHPTTDHSADAARAQSVQRAVGALDIGQACVVSAGQVLAIETDFGTAAMLEALAAQRKGARGGIFYKAPKPGQERRADLPIIGPETIHQVAQAGLDGLVIEAGGVMVLDQKAVQGALLRNELFLWVRPNEGSI